MILIWKSTGRYKLSISCLILLPLRGIMEDTEVEVTTVENLHGRLLLQQADG